MRQLQFSACLTGLLLTTGLTSFCQPAEAENAEPTALVKQYSVHEDSWQVLALRDSRPAKEQINRHILLIDTSASQVGYVREAGLTLVRNVAEQLPQTDRIQLMAMDTTCQSLTSGFSTPVSSDFAQAVRRLELRTPLGATNLKSALEGIIRQADGTATSLLWIGDGISALHTVQADEIAELTKQLTEAQVTVHSVILGPKTNPDLPATVANLTGGIVNFLSTQPEFAASIATSLRSPGLQIQKLSADGSPVVSVNGKLWLRSDRHTMAFGLRKSSQVTTVEAVLVNGRTVQWNNVVNKTGGAEIRHLYELTKNTNGIVTPVASRKMLDQAEADFQKLISTSADVASRLQRLKRTQQSENIVRRAAELDPNNLEVNTILTSLRASVPFAKQDSADDGFTAGGDQNRSLNELETMVRVRTQKLQQAVATTISDANEYAAQRPEYAESLLKDLLETIRSAHDVAPESRDELERRVIKAIAGVQNRRDQVARKQQENAVRQATNEAQEHLVTQQAVLETELQTILDQVRGSLERGRHGDIDAFEDGEAAARVAIEKKPGNGPATQALMVAEAAGQLDKARRLRELRADRFLETLYQVELSHVPFPDEPPVQYPPTDVWRALTLTRVPRYEAVSLHSESKVENWLNRMLKEPIPRLDYRGETSLGEVLEFLADHYTTTWGAVGGGSGSDFRMTIWPDTVSLELVDISSLDDVTVSDINLEGIPLRTALKLIFGKTDDPALTYVIQDDVMTITTVEEANSENSQVTRVYQVGDLVIPPIPPMGGGMMGGGMGGGMMGGGMGGGMFSVPPEWEMLLKTDPDGITASSLKKKQRR
ncbi:MAG: VWA domain-containing protein [Fuerstiella sp.]|nr:VWA domain-containing protein [Fuerstiella sp.]